MYAITLIWRKKLSERAIRKQ